MNSIILSDDSRAIELPNVLPLDRNPAIVFIASRKSPHTQRNNRRYLAQIANGLMYGQWHTPDRSQYPQAADYQAALDAYTGALIAFSWSALRFQHTQAIQVKLLELYEPGTVNVMLSALRGVLKTAWKLGLIAAEDYHRAADVDNVKYTTLPAGRDLADGEISALVSACLNDDSAAGVRDAAIIGMLYSCGMRRSEPVGLKLADYDRDSGQLKIIGGKGRKDRTVYVTGGAKAALDDWLMVRGDVPGPLFSPVNKAGKVGHDCDGAPCPMTAQAVYNMLKKRAHEAGVKDFSPHDFRRTFVGNMLDAGVDIATVANITGHSSVDTTRRYDRRPEQVKQQAANKLHFPYHKRRMV